MILSRPLRQRQIQALISFTFSDRRATGLTAWVDGHFVE